MMIEQIDWQAALAASNVLLIGITAIALLRTRREMRRNRRALAAVANRVAAAEPYDDRELRRMFDRRLTMLQKYLEQQVETNLQKTAEPPVTEGLLPPRKNELPVEYAARMARGGASVDDLVRGCGLNKGEAQLLMRLHARPQAAPATTH